MSKLSFLPHPSVTEIESGLRGWQERSPERLEVIEFARSAQGRPLLCARISDRTVPDGDKQVVLFTATHAGPEFNSCTGLLRTTKWLLGDEGPAPELRRNIVTLICPCCNPDGYEIGEVEPQKAWGNLIGGNPCSGSYTWDDVREPERNPEAVGLVRLMDEYMPDVHIDVHGVRYRQQAMWDTTGWSWGSSLARPYCRRLAHEMDYAADGAGFFPILPEDSAGRLRVTAPVEGARDHFCFAPPAISSAVFATHRFHTIAFHIETGFDEGTLVRLRRCLELGTKRWRGELYEGYPTLQVGGWVSMTVAAWGTTAGQRRASRVELWRNTSQMAYGCGHPEPARDCMMAFCATTPAGIEKYLAPGGEPSIDGPGAHLDVVLERIRREPRFNAEAVRAYVTEAPSTHAATKCPQGPAASGEPPQNGLALRLHIPYADAQIQQVRLDGHLLEPSARQGYQSWGAPGTTLQVNVPPGEVEDFHIVTCRYQTKTDRRAGFTSTDWEL